MPPLRTPGHQASRKARGEVTVLYRNHFSCESSTISIDVRAERECRHRTCKLDYQASRKGKVTVLCSGGFKGGPEGA